MMSFFLFDDKNLTADNYRKDDDDRFNDDDDHDDDLFRQSTRHVKKLF